MLCSSLFNVFEVGLVVIARISKTEQSVAAPILVDDGHDLWFHLDGEEPPRIVAPIFQPVHRGCSSSGARTQDLLALW